MQLLCIVLFGRRAVSLALDVVFLMGFMFCRKTQQPPMSIKDQEEKTKRSDFVHGLLLSVMLDDNL